MNSARAAEKSKQVPQSPEALLRNVDTFVVLMLENRSYDHYLGALELVEGRAAHGLTGMESNADARGNAVAVHELESLVLSPDLPHDWSPSRVQFNDGKNDGFVAAYGRRTADPSAAMGYHTRRQLPVTYALADVSAVCSRWFASVMGPTWPNRYYLHCATAQGEKHNHMISARSIFDELDAHGVSNRYYFSSLAFPAAYGKTSGYAPLQRFFDDASAGTLPHVSFIDPIFTALDVVGNDDHPPADVRDGQALIASIYNALGRSPQWQHTLLIVTYDEHGGFYDHVPPPLTEDEHPEFRQLGFRVPSLVIGPQVRRDIVDTQFDHVSVVSTLTRKFGLTPLTRRVEATNDLSSCIDPAAVDRPRPPVALPKIAMRRDIQGPLENQKLGGQYELAWLVERQLRADWRWHADRARRSLHANGNRLGALNLF